MLRESLRLLTPTGRLALVLPFDQRAILLEEAEQVGLHPYRETQVSTRQGMPPKRLLIELGQETVTPQCDHLAIEDESHHYTPAFIALERPFYLKI